MPDPNRPPQLLMRGRIAALSVSIAVTFGLLAARLAFICGAEGPYLAAKAAVQHAQHLPLELPRGEIFDRNGFPLTNCALQENLAAFPTLIPLEQRSGAAISIARLTGIPTASILHKLTSREPVILARRIPRSTMAAVARLGITGVMPVKQHSRYQEGSPAPHVIGYVRASDNTGITGIEARFDEYLRQGQAQSLSAMVDAKGRLIPGLSFKITPKRAGEGLSGVTLTLDAGVQNRLERAMSQVKMGAAVAIEPRTGDVLAMVSRPSYDQSDVGPSLDDTQKSLLNRAMMDYYPGSVFKLVTAAAAFDLKAVSPNDAFYDPGYFQVPGGQRVRCSKVGGHGDITFSEAISKSCNTVFVDVALRLGAAPIVEAARRLGLGSPLGIELPQEQGGALPAPETCTRGDIANMALGQKGVKVTPLQAAALMCAIVNDGAFVQPHLVQSVTDPKGRSVPGYPIRPTVRQAMSPQAARNIRYALEKAVGEGTGRQAQGIWGGSAGKTGTAQTGRHDASGRPLSHAWFVGYAPVLEPSIAVAIVVEDGGAGGEVAAPIFKDFITSLH